MIKWLELAANFHVGACWATAEPCSAWLLWPDDPCGLGLGDDPGQTDPAEVQYRHEPSLVQATRLVATGIASVGDPDKALLVGLGFTLGSDLPGRDVEGGLAAFRDGCADGFNRGEGNTMLAPRATAPRRDGANEGETMNADEMNPIAPVVVVGAGQAGFSAAAKLRDLGYAGPMTLVGNEAHPPYQRPPLSKAYLNGEVADHRLHLRPLAFYGQKGIDLRLSTHVERIDRSARQVELADGGSLPYGRLVLATGARPRILPAALGGELDGVYSLRKIADIDAMAAEFRPGRRMLVIGGGYVGLEAAAMATKLGLRVTLIEAAPRILQRVAAAETSAFFRALHRAHGVDLREGTGLETLRGEGGRIRAATLTDGTEVPVDFAIVGIGVHPNAELAAEAGLETENGISVDTHLRTSDPHILAAGDCASFPWRGGRFRLESVGNAVDQGEAVAAAIMGRSTGFEPEPWFWSDQFDVKLQIAGLSAGYDAVLTRNGTGASPSFWYYRGADLIAVDAVNDPRVFMVAKRLIALGKSPPQHLVTRADADLKSLLL